MRPDLWLTLKENVLVTDLQMIRPDLFIVLGYVSWWCFNNNLPCRVTSLIDDVPQRVTATHSEGRAADVSTRTCYENSQSRKGGRCEYARLWSQGYN